MHHIAVVVLNYNTERDLQKCAQQIAAQINVHISIILVDNDSCYDSTATIKTWIKNWRPDAISGSESLVRGWVFNHPECLDVAGNVFLIENNENLGYSSGNNTGIRLADILNADAVLIANPDMQIDDPHYLAVLSQQLFADSENMVAASRIVGPDGQEQNPLREANFWEELIWPRFLFWWIFKPNAYVISCPSDRPIAVPKVSGCCMMLRMDFLRATNYLDENVFLYCEEPILSARVKAAGGRIIFVPTISATHAHVKSEKGDNTKRMLQLFQSRKYYLKTYSGYNRLQLWLLNLSYALFAIFIRLKGVIRSTLSERATSRGTSHA